MTKIKVNLIPHMFYSLSYPRWKCAKLWRIPNDSEEKGLSGILEIRNSESLVCTYLLSVTLWSLVCVEGIQSYLVLSVPATLSFCESCVIKHVALSNEKASNQSFLRLIFLTQRTTTEISFEIHLEIFRKLMFVCFTKLMNSRAISQSFCIVICKS